MKTLAWVVAAICSLQDVGAMYKKAGRAEHLADDQSLNVSQSMGSVTSTTTMNLDAGDPNILPTAHNLEHSLLHKLEEKAVEIKREHPTKKHMDEQKKEADAKHEHTIHLCQRDYSQPCPLGFKHIAAEDGGHRCIPPSSYTGPCMGQDLVYRAMPAEEKASWATSCLANWPCVRCRRRYSDLCPEKWELDKRDNTSKGMSARFQAAKSRLRLDDVLHLVDHLGSRRDVRRHQRGAHLALARSLLPLAGLGQAHAVLLLNRLEASLARHLDGLGETPNVTEQLVNAHLVDLLVRITHVLDGLAKQDHDVLVLVLHEGNLGLGVLHEVAHDGHELVAGVLQTLGSGDGVGDALHVVLELCDVALQSRHVNFGAVLADAQLVVNLEHSLVLAGNEVADVLHQGFHGLGGGAELVQLGEGGGLETLGVALLGVALVQRVADLEDHVGEHVQTRARHDGLAAVHDALERSDDLLEVLLEGQRHVVRLQALLQQRNGRNDRDELLGAVHGVHVAARLDVLLHDVYLLGRRQERHEPLGGLDVQDAGVEAHHGVLQLLEGVLGELGEPDVHVVGALRVGEQVEHLGLGHDGHARLGCGLGEGLLDLGLLDVGQPLGAREQGALRVVAEDGVPEEPADAGVVDQRCLPPALGLGREPFLQRGGRESLWRALLQRRRGLLGLGRGLFQNGHDLGHAAAWAVAIPGAASTLLFRGGALRLLLRLPLHLLGLLPQVGQHRRGQVHAKPGGQGARGAGQRLGGRARNQRGEAEVVQALSGQQFAVRLDLGLLGWLGGVFLGSAARAVLLHQLEREARLRQR
ncbi:CPW-WPC family protein [Babesia caballi]|uniref:CPW-WPC family protein n=1 Tax=Babesia caballi TaxID=5871 RepID=A0AAV4LWM2_BABCB|nr:CPW-WPC family protein [Babesia caballi]